jgi:hypothetical protein
VFERITTRTMTAMLEASMIHDDNDDDNDNDDEGSDDDDDDESEMLGRGGV